MKAYWRIFTLAVILALLVISSLPAAAADEATFSGICWFLEEPDSPELRDWYNGKDDMIYHMRNEKQLAICDFTDDRLDGYMLITPNWDVVFDWSLFPFAGWITGHDHGDATYMDMDGNVTFVGRFNNHIDETSTAYGDGFANGVGEYEGLHFKNTIYYSLTGNPDWAVHMEGVIK